jgi:hypothetical protein
MRGRFVLSVLGCLVLAAALLPGSGIAATPAAGTVSPTSTTTTWKGGPFVVSTPQYGTSECTDVTCDVYKLTIVPQATGSTTVTIETSMAAGNDIDLYVYDPAGRRVGSSAGETGNERVVLNDPPAGTYTVRVLPWLVEPLATFDGKATMTNSLVPTTKDSTLWAYDRSAPQASVEVPLRVVMVGFQQGEVDAAKVLGEIPNSQRPGVLIPRGSSPSGDVSPLFGAETLVNHGRRYYQDARPFLVPFEYKWKPQLVYAPAAFADALFAQMRAQSSTGEFANSRNRQYLEGYNAERGVFRGGENSVPANAPVRFVNGEGIEDWIAANSASYLGFDGGPKGGKGKKNTSANPGYTVYVLNTWDSPQAKQHLRPEHEYHVWKINRTDPDTGEFDGIDWARIWGGRYRMMLVDTGAAPNPYEAETWGNRNRTVNGSRAYDPPLWEYRAGAPRPVTAVNLGSGVEQAVTPGEKWDGDQLNFMLGRTVGQAASFRFLHSYLYEPWPGTGRFWFSENVWHDAKAELPWASDLTKLYNQTVVLGGLRTLAPYFDIQGDVRFQYLGQGGADFTADQAMLDQAKLDGDDVAGVPGISMHTVTAMDYLDSKPDRFLRGGSCFTSVPGISVVAEKHYAWALPIAAGIATNREGVPWGYLNSVNDVFKTPRADRDETMRMTHPEVGTGAFTYTAVHEASHFLGLAHPHDSIGATRNADGSPRYYDGFTWAFNSTAAPTTYSHTELVYSILDQESIARGHTGYYLEWADESLAEGGEAYYRAGKTTVDLLPADARALRTTAIDMSKKAEALFAKFDFVNATYAAQAAFRAAASYRDLALGLAPGTTELEHGTKKTGAEACVSATG